MSAIQAFVSSRYVVIKHVSLGSGWLLSSSGHKGLRRQTIELSEPRLDIREDRFDEHASTGATHADAIAFEPVLARQAHGLTPTVSEQLGCGRHVASGDIYQ
jgi:hypothetical protein